MWTGAIDVWHFLHGFTLDAAIFSLGYLADADRMCTFLGCHFVFLLDRTLTKLLRRTRRALCPQQVAAAARHPRSQSMRDASGRPYSRNPSGLSGLSADTPGSVCGYEPRRGRGPCVVRLFAYARFTHAIKQPACPWRTWIYSTSGRSKILVIAASAAPSSTFSRAVTHRSRP